MIDLMKEVVKGDKGIGSFEVVPKGKYLVELISVDEWKSKENKKKIVYTYNENYQREVDGNGKPVGVKKDFISYSTRITMRILEGEYRGNLVSVFINLHPNAPWVLPNMIGAFLGIGQTLHPKDIKKLEGKVAWANIDDKPREKTVTDEDTGDKTIELVPNNEVKSFKALTDEERNNLFGSEDGEEEEDFDDLI